ncbi:hypothetical protein [Aestuariispira ectoiniformans]|uniref:hypothetical protein n=1 Tax=Aestuariispira ectoiniformans TaxID=2775080 RepID=UPI00223B3220|nr:hypothetical protein [Aestuariispira ectoiniformans]
MHSKAEISGAAALAICESMLLCLTDSKVITKQQVVGLLEDAVNAHRNAMQTSGQKSGPTSGGDELHKEIADLIAAIIAGGNSVRHL